MDLIDKLIMENHTLIAAPFVRFPILKNLATSLLISICQISMKDACFWNQEEQDWFIKKRLQYILKRTNQIPFWFKRFTTAGFDVLTPFSFEEFGKIPFLTREELQSHQNLNIEDVKIYRRTIFEIKSSGSTNLPMTALLDPRMMPMREAIWREQFGVKENYEKERVLSLAMGNAHGYTIKNFWRFFLPSDFNEEELISVVKGFNPTVLVSAPSRLLSVAKILEEANVKLPLKRVYVLGETLTDDIRTYFESYFSCPVINTLGSVETGGLALSCKENKLHIFPQWIYIEIVDEEGRRVSDGVEGRIVITHLHNLLSPLIRYENGDRGVLNSERCRCGRTSPCLKIKGRTADFVILRDGSPLSFMDFISKVIFPFAEGIKEFQFVQEKAGELSLFIVFSKLIKDKDGLKKTIQSKLKELSKNRIATSVIETKNIPYRFNHWKQKAFVSFIKNPIGD